MTKEKFGRMVEEFTFDKGTLDHKGKMSVLWLDVVESPSPKLNRKVKGIVIDGK